MSRPVRFVLLREWLGPLRRRAVAVDLDKVDPALSSKLNSTDAAAPAHSGAAVPMSTAAWRRYAKPAAAALVLALLTPTLLLSETRIKALIDEALGGCLFVLEQRVLEQHGGPAAATVDVRGYLSGKAPPSLDLVFRATRGMVNEVEFLSGILVSAPTAYSSLVLHPLAGQRCPGGLCGGSNPILQPRAVIPIQINNPSPNFDYLFRVKLDPAAASAGDGALIVYSVAREGQTEVCRVEPANAFNWVARLDKLGRFFVYCAVLFVLTALVIVFRNWSPAHDNNAS